jgi:hypothetical protein
MLRQFEGCNEIIFNPLIHWWRRGPISKQLRGFVWSNVPVHYKIGMMSCVFLSFFFLETGLNRDFFRWDLDMFSYCKSFTTPPRKKSNQSDRSDRWHSSRHRRLHRQLSPPGLRTPAGQILPPLVRDPPCMHRRLPGYWESRIHASRVSAWSSRFLWVVV